MRRGLMTVRTDPASAVVADGMFPAAALLVALAIAATAGTAAFAPALYLALATPLLTLIDVREHRLPHGIVLPGYGAAALGLASAVIQGHSIGSVLACGAGGFAAFAALALRGGIGMGDVTLAGLLGLSAGLVSPTVALGALLVALVLGAAAAVVAVRRARESVAFGPFLLAGYWVALTAPSVAGSLPGV